MQITAIYNATYLGTESGDAEKSDITSVPIEARINRVYSLSLSFFPRPLIPLIHLHHCSLHRFNIQPPFLSSFSLLLPSPS
jgi:hypothetical protein